MAAAFDDKYMMNTDVARAIAMRASAENKKEEKIDETEAVMSRKSFDLFVCYFLPLSMFISAGNESRMIFVIFELGKFKS